MDAFSKGWGEKLWLSNKCDIIQREIIISDGDSVNHTAIPTALHPKFKFKTLHSYYRRLVVYCHFLLSMILNIACIVGFALFIIDKLNLKLYILTVLKLLCRMYENHWFKSANIKFDHYSPGNDTTIYFCIYICASWMLNMLGNKTIDMALSQPVRGHNSLYCGQFLTSVIMTGVFSYNLTCWDERA